MLKSFLLILIIIHLMTSSGCTKFTPKESETHPLSGTYQVKKVLRSSVDNEQTEVHQYYSNGLTFINPLEVSGLDTIYTDFSLIKITDGSIFFQQVINGIDTTWKTSYVAQDESFVKRNNPYYCFYPNGLKRIWKIIDISDSTLTIDASTQWPNGNIGTAYATTFFLRKL